METADLGVEVELGVAAVVEIVVLILAEGDLAHHLLVLRQDLGLEQQRFGRSRNRHVLKMRSRVNQT